MRRRGFQSASKFFRFERTAGKPVEVRGLGGGGGVVRGKRGSKPAKIPFRFSEEPFGVIADRRAAAVAVAVEPEGAANADDVRRPIGRRGLIRLGGRPVWAVDARPEGNGHQVHVVPWTR